MTANIPFNRASMAGPELEYIRQAVESGHISGDGPFTKRCHRLLEETADVKKALLTTSCTHALEMAALLLDFGAGDEVIVPSFTFVSTPNAFVLRGAKPVFVDIRSDTLNLDERALEAKIGPRTKAICLVHYAGIACEMNAIMELANAHRIPVVEDNAHGLFGRYRGRPLGSFGAMATLSFHETKNLSCGEGGALLIQDQRLTARAEIIREKGTNRSRFFRGEVDKYGWVDVGSSYLPSDVLAAFLFAQLEARAQIQVRRQAIWEGYATRLGPWAAKHGIGLPTVPSHVDQAFHLFYLLLPSLDRRTAFIAHMKAHGIGAPFHYLPLHLSPMGERFGGRAGDCPVTEEVSDRLVRLPLFTSLSDSELDRVVDVVTQFS